MQTFRGSKAGRVSMRVHFNQLALFPDDPVESTVSAPAEVAHERNDGTDSARRSDPEALAGALPANGAGSGKGESPGAGGVRGTDPDGRPAVRAGVGEEDGLSGGVGTGEGGVGVAPDGEQQRGPELEPEREPPAGRDLPVRDIEIRDIEIHDIEEEPAARPPPRDFRLNEPHRIGQGGLKEKDRDNIAAIRTLRLVEDVSRQPTENEKSVLARYSGWGALSNVFHPYPRSDLAETAREVRQHLTPEE